MNGTVKGISKRALIKVGILSCVLALFPGVIGSARAQWVVYDPTNWIENYAQQYQDAAEYMKTAQRWKEQYDYIQRMLVQGGIFNAQAMSMADQFMERDLTDGVKEECGQQGVIDMLWKLVPAIGSNESVKDRQLRICQQLVVAKNAKYNETVKVLKTIKGRNGELAKIAEDRLKVGDSQGKLDANNNQLDSFQSRVQMDIQYWQAIDAAYDSYIDGLNDEQKRLASLALKGESGPFGQVLKGAVLGAALQSVK